MTRPDLPADLPTDLPADLPHEVAERVEPPGFEEVLARAAGARRRRRTTVGASLAAVLAVGGLAFAVGDPSDREGRSDGPADRTGTWDGTSQMHPGLPADVRDLLGAERLDAWSVSGSGGATAVLWGACEDGVRCRLAVVTRLGDRVEGRALATDDVTMSPVPGGWLLDDEEALTRLTPEGDLQRVFDPGGSASGAEAGDTAVPTSLGPRLLRGDKLLPVPTPDGSRVHSAFVTPAGRLVVAAADGDDIVLSTTDDSRSWVTRRGARTPGPAATAVLGGHGDDVAAVFLGDDRDGSVPVVGLLLSDDAGGTWTAADLGGLDGLHDVSAMTVSDEGTAFLTTGSHGLVRVEGDGDAAMSRMSPHDYSAHLVAHRVCLVTEAGRVDHLRCSADDGATWEDAPLPGFR